MSKKNVTTNATVDTTIEVTKMTLADKRKNTSNLLKGLFGKLKNVKFVDIKKMKMSELCRRVLGDNPDILTPDFQRAPYTFKQVYLDKLMSGLITGLDPKVSRIIVGVYNGQWYLIDGLQRCSACYQFLRGQAGFTIFEDGIKQKTSMEIWYTVPSGKEKRLYQLDDEYKEFLDNLEFTVEFVECNSMDEMRDVFMAINTSTLVSSAAKNNAYSTEMLLAEVEKIMFENQNYIDIFSVKNLKGKNNGDAVMSQKTMFKDFLLMCLYLDDFTGQSGERAKGSLTDYRDKKVRLEVTKTQMKIAKTLFNDCMELMGKLCIDATRKNLATYRVAFILVLNIIKNGHYAYFKETNRLSDLLKNMTVLPTTSGQCCSLTEMHEKEIYLYDTYLTPYVNSINSGLEEIYTSPDDNDDDRFVA